MSAVFLPDLTKLSFTLLLSIANKTKDGCWNWAGETKNGFGQIVVDHVVQSAYHYAYSSFKGGIVNGFIPTHKCRNDLCCNPGHMELKKLSLPKGNWLPAPDLPKHFMVSESGQLFSIRSGKILKQNLFAKSYLGIVTRLNGRKGKCKILRAHVQVAKAFVPNPDNKPQVNHKNGLKLCNGKDNLEWVTAKENTIHAIETGLIDFDKGIRLVSLTPKQVREALKFKKLSARKVAKMFNVSRAVIDRLRKNPVRYLELAERLQISNGAKYGNCSSVG